MDVQVRGARQRSGCATACELLSPRMFDDFEDLNLKIAVLSALMEDGHYAAEAERLAELHGAATAPHLPIPEVMAFYRAIELRPALLSTVTRLCPDTSDSAYEHAMNDWDGDDDTFDITSLVGIERLTNLVTFAPVSLIAEGGIDYGPLVRCERLVSVDMSFARPGKESETVAARLRGRGVVVTGT